MARSGVQYEDVQRAVDSLLESGESPSVQKVREALGTGSYTTISDHLREWRRLREANRDRPARRGMPDAIQALTDQLWVHAQEAAGEALAHYREEADRQAQSARDAATETLRRAEDAEQRESALAAHLASTEHRLEARCAEVARGQAERDALAEREARLTRQLEQREALLATRQQEQQEQAALHHRDLQQRDTEHRERLTREEQRHESAEARLMSLLDEARRERQGVEKAHVAREKQLETRLERLHQEAQESRGRLAEAEKQYRQADWSRARAEEKVLTRDHELSLLQARVDDQKRLLDEQARRLRDLEAQLNRRLWASPAEPPEDDATTEERGKADEPAPSDERRSRHGEASAQR